MIIARMFGGLGNQLFIYAYAFSLSRKLNKELVLDTKSGFSRDFVYQRTDNLKYLGVNTRTPGRSFTLDNFFGRLIRIILRKYDLPARIFGIYFVTDKNLHKMNFERLAKARYIFLDGYFNSYHLFNEYKDEIFKSLKIDSTINLTNYKKQNSVEKSINIGIHFRSYKDVPLKDRSENLIVNGLYYKNAIDMFLKKYENPNFIIFSDDIKEAQKVIKTKNMFFIENSDDMNLPSQIKDFIMLLNCDHFIIANSTFSWWAAYLSDNKNKTVIRPSEQFYSQNRNFYPAEWIEI